MDIRKLSKICDSFSSLNLIEDDYKDDMRAESLFTKYQDRSFEALVKAMISQLSRIKDKDKFERRKEVFKQMAKNHSGYDESYLNDQFSQLGESDKNENIDAENSGEESSDKQNSEKETSESKSSKDNGDDYRSVDNLFPVNRGSYTASLYRYLNSLIMSGFQVKLKLLNHWTPVAQNKARRNGRVWELPYSLSLKKDGKVVKNLDISLITNEGGGMYGYTINDYHFYRSFRDFIDAVSKEIGVE